MNKRISEKIFLFSIDLEDVRFLLPEGKKYKPRVAVNTHAYLDWLKKNNFKCTFFTVGDVAENYPSLINEIISEGHEIGCHTNTHITLDRQSPETFREDLEKNIENLVKAGADNIRGFRAPVFSLTEKTEWAYRILSELNFTYSSSVLPAKSPLFGWEEFGSAPKMASHNILEIPMTVGKVGHMNMPYGGGVYFRMLPSFLIRKKAAVHSTAGNPLLGYFHPYDIDTEQEHFMHPGINNSKLYNFLMYYNRNKVFDRLNGLIESGFRICTYSNYIKTYLEN
jgi:polysaccharide deacetylase family protein (PEP-CTERM system associated)